MIIKGGEGMVYIGSVGLGVPPYSMKQEEVKQLVDDLFTPKVSKKIAKLRSVFDNALVSERQFVVHKDWFREPKSFKNVNEVYIENAIHLSIEAIDNCLHHPLLKDNIPYDAIDLIVFISSSGISTPSIDAHIINKRPFREDIKRMPLWGLGCAGGAIGISRGYEWAKLHKDKNVLIVSSELCSITFQRNDTSTSNIVGTALFGDGVAATLLVGEKSKYKELLPNNKLQIKNTSSFTKKNTLHIMGWNISDTGFEVIFSKKIPKLVKTLWKDHVLSLLKEENITKDDLNALIAHPGGRKVLEEMEQSLQIDRDLLRYSYEVLRDHGNMSSATVMYVLEKWLNCSKNLSFKENKGILCALGPGFSSELISLEWIGS